MTIVLLCSTNSWSSDQLPVPKFDMSLQNLSHAGHIKIVWNWPHDQDVTFELQQADTATFNNAEVIYNGPDRASFISGLANGNYYYRLKAISDDGDSSSKWSKTVVLKVRHHSLALALSLAGIGAFVFIVTSAVVIKGSYQKESKS